MAKIKLKFGENEIEIESRDFYVDNETLGQVIANVSRHIQENKAQIVFDEQPTSYFSEKSNSYESSTVLDSLEEAEVHEPEFIDTTNMLRSNEYLKKSNEEKSKLLIAYEEYTDELENLVTSISKIKGNITSLKSRIKSRKKPKKKVKKKRILKRKTKAISRRRKSRKSRR